MKLFECRRYNENDDCYSNWRGALLIAAETEGDAILIFRKAEYGDDPKEIVVFENIEVGGNPRVIYNDDCR